MVLVGPLELMGTDWLVLVGPPSTRLRANLVRREPGGMWRGPAGSAGGMWLGHARVSRLWLALGQFGHWHPLAVARLAPLAHRPA